MHLQPIKVKRLPEKFLSDDRRVLARPFMPGGPARVPVVVKRVLGLSDAAAAAALAEVRADFATRHRDFETDLRENFEHIRPWIEQPGPINETNQLLIGAYFTMEYSIESVALFNPSIVPHPDQSNLEPGALRFIMSLRAIGEGHISSIVFRIGVITADGDIIVEPASRFVERAELVKNPTYHKPTFFAKLIEMEAYNDHAQSILDLLSDDFSFTQLETAIGRIARHHGVEIGFQETVNSLIWLAKSNYQLIFPPGCDPSEVVIFPTTDDESRGIEDARFVRFVEGDGAVTYYGTYTAYNGQRILPQLLQTGAFREFRINTLNGRYVQNKGLALFPRQVDGRYLMVSRIDGQNLYVMPSTNLRLWNEAIYLQEPAWTWDFVQIGNCGSPLETPAGWLLLTHGVGPVRRYCIGASLLDLKNPYRVIGRLTEPLITPNEQEREGYVPNVVYSCGALIHNDELIIPYGLADSATSFAKVNLTELLEHLVR